MYSREKIAKIVSEVLNDDSIFEYLIKEDDLTKLNLNSINFIKIIVNIEVAFNIEFDDTMLNYMEFPSFGEFCDIVESLITSDN